MSIIRVSAALGGNFQCRRFDRLEQGQVEAFPVRQAGGGGHRDARAGKDDELAVPGGFHQRRQRWVGRETHSVPGNVAVFSDAEFGLHCKVKQVRLLPQRNCSAR
jgi:hypothetical protein